MNVGLDTQTYTVAAAGTYNVKFSVTEIPPTGLSVLVKSGASTIYTMQTIGQTQSAAYFKFSFQAALNDVITVVLSSSAGIDAQFNNVKSTISIGQGL